MEVVSAGTIWIKNENIPELVAYQGNDHKVDTVKVLFISETGKDGPLYTLRPTQLPLYQSVKKTLSNDTYAKIGISVQLKKSANIAHFCYVDKETFIPVNDKTTVYLGLSHEDGGLQCTLRYSDKPEIDT